MCVGANDSTCLANSDSEKRSRFFQAAYPVDSATSEDAIARMIALGAGSSASIFATPDLLPNTGRKSKTLKLFTDDGNIKSDMMGSHENLKVWFNPNSIANTLSLSRAATKHRVAIVSSKNESIFAQIEGKGWVKFCLDSAGVLACDVRDGASEVCFNNIDSNFQAHSSLQAVDSSASKFTTAEVKQANDAKSLAK